ncbi:MAG TPA: putative quinol monooxygenase [Candidatus Binataceae bacterium]|nr:putative quinol monooxygenase [Candidatus Binataceae bacterium]
MPITVIAKLKVKPGSEAAFEAAAMEMIEKIRPSEAGTLSYVLHKNNADPTEFVYYEVYSDPAALGAHSGSEHMKAFGGMIAALLAGRPEIAMYSEVARK